MAEQIFQGRVRIPGTLQASAVVSYEPVDLPQALAPTLQRHRAAACPRASGQLAKKKIVGTALCAPRDGGTMAAGEVLESASAYGAAPACILLAGEASDPLIAGAALCGVSTQWPVAVIDCLGEEFLAAVADGMRITLCGTGEVAVQTQE